MKIIKVKSYEDMSEKACELLVDKMNNLKKPVFGLASGATPSGLYERFIENYKQKKVSFQLATTFNLDEYVRYSKDSPRSYHYYMSRTTV